VLFGRVEKIVGGVGDAHFVAGSSGIAAGIRGFAAIGVDALNGSSAGKNAGAALMADHMKEQPRNRVGLGRGRAGYSFTDHAAAIVGSPGGPTEMLAEGFSVFSEELRVGLLERPAKTRDSFLAGVDLIALGVEGKEQLLAGGRLEDRGNLLSEEELGQRDYRKEYDREDWDTLGHAGILRDIGSR
jgi:hypothetical protein